MSPLVAVAVVAVTVPRAGCATAAATGGSRRGLLVPNPPEDEREDEQHGDPNPGVALRRQLRQCGIAHGLGRRWGRKIGWSGGVGNLIAHRRIRRIGSLILQENSPEGTTTANAAMKR